MGIGGGAAFDDIREQASDENFNRGTWLQCVPAACAFHEPVDALTLFVIAEHYHLSGSSGIRSAVLQQSSANKATS